MRRALLVVGTLAACQGPPREVANQCIPAWPAARQVGFAPRLTGKTPALLFHTPLTSGITSDWLVADQAHVAFTAGGRLYILDHDGTFIVSRGGLSAERVSSPLLLDDGAFAFAGASGYVVAADGSWRAVVPLPPGPTPAASPSAGRLIASRLGRLYVGADDGSVLALEAATGVLGWRVPLAGAGERPPSVLGGIGGGLFVSAPDTARAPDVLDAATGAALQRFDGETVVMAGPTLGLVTQAQDEASLHYPWMHLGVRDPCGKLRWRLPAERPQWPVLVGAEDRLYVVERDDTPQSPTFVSVYAADGTRLVDDAPAAIPWALGADGTIYGLRCDSPGHEGPSRLTAYDQDLTERWHVDLGAICPHGGPIIDDQGRLFFTAFDGEWTSLYGVQTDSPGLLGSAWPVRRVDRRGTAWVE
jgi:outer membrane protein assembly factor BamB